jgi:predicted PurR-regulated permease PerM
MNATSLFNRWIIKPHRTIDYWSTHPFLFVFIASILTFIPSVGIMISSLLPIAVSWITYNSIWYPLAVIAFFSVVQALEAFIIFSFAVGSRLKKNTLVIIIVVIVGGILWGAAGIILFIPFNKYHKIDCRPHT